MKIHSAACKQMCDTAVLCRVLKTNGESSVLCGVPPKRIAGNLCCATCLQTNRQGSVMCAACRPKATGSPSLCSVQANTYWGVRCAVQRAKNTRRDFGGAPKIDESSVLCSVCPQNWRERCAVQHAKKRLGKTSAHSVPQNNDESSVRGSVLNNNWR